MLIRRLACAALLGLSLAACSSSKPGPPVFPDIRFSDASKLTLDVSSIAVKADFEPSFHAPEIEQNFPVPPQRAIANWAHDSLQAGNPGSQFTARVTIIDASAHARPHGDEDERHYDVRASATVDILDPQGKSVRSAHAEASRVAAEAADASSDELDRLWYDMTKDVVASLTDELDRQMRGSFYPYLQQ